MRDSTSGVRIPLYLTPEHPCPYLPEQQATTAFVGTELPCDKSLYSALLRLGFRRSGNHVYKPRCVSCNACLPIRIPVAELQLSRSQRRCLAKNEDLIVGWSTQSITDEHFQLYERYINQRHFDGDMYPARREQFFDFLQADWCETRLLECRLQNELVATVVCDVAADGLSAVYSFFEPELASRSLGTFGILSLAAMARLDGLPHLYLGYYIKNCRKMNYKNLFQPLQAFNGIEWQPLKDGEA